jgi:hypothetical protein
MSSYRRPAIMAIVYRDSAGEPIRYGERWRSGSPPEESYSRTSNLARFQPLQTIADALISHLGETFDVVVDDDPTWAADLLHPRDDVTRAVRVTPASGAPLTLVYTSFPSVILHAGALFELLYPVCGCDACDESWSTLADELEWQVLAVAAGGLREDFDDADLVTLLEDPDRGSLGGRRASDDIAPARLERARVALAAGEGWDAWPLR